MPFDDWFWLIRGDERHPFKLNRDEATGHQRHVMLETMDGLAIGKPGNLAFQLQLISAR